MVMPAIHNKIGFLHIPRTGGTYLEALLCSMGPERFINFFGTPNNQTPNKVGLIENIDRDVGRQKMLQNIPNWDTAELFSGHFSLNISKFVPNKYTYKYLTILRNPINRVVSFVKKVTSSKNFAAAIAKDCDVGSDQFWDNFIQYRKDGHTYGLMPHELHGFSNYMTKAIAGLNLSDPGISVNNDVYSLAKQNLDEMIYVGKFEDYNNTILHILNMFKCTHARINIKTETKHHLSSHVLSFLEDTNQYDIKLYRNFFNE